MDDQFLKPIYQMQKAKPANNLFSKIEASIFETTIIPIQTLTIAAACILLLLFVNIYAVKNNTVSSISESASTYNDELINDFQIY